MFKKVISVCLVVCFSLLLISQYRIAYAQDAFEKIEALDKRLQETDALFNKTAEADPATSTWKHIFMGDRRFCSVDQDGNTFYYHYDARGNVNVITDKNGEVVQRIEYMPFGEVASIEVKGANNLMYRFSGKEYHDEIGLYYYGARWYDPQIGRWITPDPTVQHPYDDPQDLNRYAYCRNNPITLDDPTGLGWKKFWGKVWNEIKGPLIAAAIVVATAFLFGGPQAMWAAPTVIAASSAFWATATLDTGEGRSAIRSVGREVFDDAFGMRPRTALIWSSIFVHTAVSLGYEWGTANLLYNPAPVVKEYSPATDGPIEGGGIEPYGDVPTKTNFETWSEIKNFGRGADDTVFVGKRPVTGPLSKAKLNHIAAVSTEGFGNTVTRVNQATWATSMTCHQVSNGMLVARGFSNTVLGMSWDTYLSTLLYGNYGGGLYYKTVTGIQARDEYKD
ncbi:MAG: RHS repeat-associated core domain-containing protein [Nitrospirae bacterium]|nr:RHS repeat-associated core domain-containing protein [Nitrospirota bacterium]